MYVDADGFVVLLCLPFEVSDLQSFPQHRYRELTFFTWQYPSGLLAEDGPKTANNDGDT